MIALAYGQDASRPSLSARDRASLHRGQELRERGFESVTRNCRPFMREGFRVIFDLSKTSALITSDDIRKRMPEEFHPKFPNAWGALMVQAAKLGLIRRTGRYVPSVLPGNRARRVELWASDLYQTP